MIVQKQKNQQSFCFHMVDSRRLSHILCSMGTVYVKLYATMFLVVFGFFADLVCHPSCAVFRLWGNPPQSCMVGHEHCRPGCHGVARRVPVPKKRIGRNSNNW